MANPFEKRATEYLRDDVAFLAVVTPEPLITFFQKPAEQDRLYDRLAVVVGTPGSGKTTLARLFQFSTLHTLLRSRELSNYKPLIDAMTSCGAVKDERATISGARLPLEGEYRDFWEFPYPEDLRASLMIALLQARAVLTWLRNFEAAGIKPERVSIVPRAEADAALAAIGGKDGPDLLARAREMERLIYAISAALVPPDIADIDARAVAAYRPFDVIEAFSVTDGDTPLTLRPLAMFDDAHALHPNQLQALQRWLIRRELRVARWILTRMDAMTPADVLLEKSSGDDVEPGVKRAREVTDIWMQSTEGRANQRRAFRKMAKDMAARYLSQMEVFSRRRLTNIADLLATAPERLPAGKLNELAKSVDVLQTARRITADRRALLEEEVGNYLRDKDEDCEEMRLAMLAILIERYANRTKQRSLFEDGEVEDDPNPTRPLVADALIAEGARIHLLHSHDRPYFYGIDAVCDASSENAEQFLQLTARLVSQSETQLIRRRPGTLNAGQQNKLLRRRASDIVRAWDFPQHRMVRKLADGIADECLVKSLEGNASLAGGPTAFGIPQDEFDAIPKEQSELARVLQFGIAYNAFVLVPNHGTKKKLWCLVELGGILLLHYGLSLNRGNFVERHPSDLAKFITSASHE